MVAQLIRNVGLHVVCALAACTAHVIVDPSLPSNELGKNLLIVFENTHGDDGGMGDSLCCEWHQPFSRSWSLCTRTLKVASGSVHLNPDHLLKAHARGDQGPRTE